MSIDDCLREQAIEDRYERARNRVRPSNEARADWGEAGIIAGTPDFGQHGDTPESVLIDASDAVADILHAGMRYGLTPETIIDKARKSWLGDHEDGSDPALCVWKELYE